MKFIGIICLILLVIGGLNWGLIGLANFDLVAAIFGAGTFWTRFIYGLVGLAAVFKIWACWGCCHKCEQK
jgi:hypothetical protein